jgi:hypothetical protein
MREQNDAPSRFGKFDKAVTKILSVSHGELERREAKWKRKRERRKQAKRK